MGGHRRPLLVAAGAFSLVGIVAIGGIATARDRTLRASLDGVQEVPDADPDGTGKARVTVDEETGEVCFTVRFNGVGTPNRGHIHTGIAGANGGIVVPFFELVGVPADPRNDDLEDGHLEGCVTLDPAVPANAALLADIADHPEEYYVNLHNARFPGGAVRGQLE